VSINRPLGAYWTIFLIHTDYCFIIIFVIVIVIAVVEVIKFYKKFNKAKSAYLIDYYKFQFKLSHLQIFTDKYTDVFMSLSNSSRKSM
jgi:hypothetical protein